MNQTHLEARLRCLKPREPSARIRRRLFSGSAGHGELANIMRWFAPVTACALLAVTILRQEDAGLRGRRVGPRQPYELSASNAAAMSYEPEINRLPAIFEWTNRGNSAFSIRSFLPVTTN